MIERKSILLLLGMLTMNQLPAIAAVDIRAQSNTVIAAGKTLAVAPAPIRTVTNEALKLSAQKPQGFAVGTKLQGCNARDVNAAGSLLAETLEVRTADGVVLKNKEDYLVEPVWAAVGIGPKSRVTPQDTVFASYRYSLMRMDTIQVAADGTPSLKAGTPHISVPVPPPADAGCRVVAHVFVNYRDKQVKPDQIYPILEGPELAVTGSTPGRIPKTLAKLRNGKPVTIVCWGDSVTEGGNASKPEFRYVDVFGAGLRQRFPKAKIELKNISAGGSSSAQWLHPDQYPYRGKRGAASAARLERVIEAQPDLVTIEFVNDAKLTAEQTANRYDEILARLKPTGAEVILITPHFTSLNWMGFRGMREAEKRPYVLGLRAFAGNRQVALADASARWEHLWKEGLPYITLLHNTINHPDDRGHRLFAEELWKCFE